MTNLVKTIDEKRRDRLVKALKRTGVAKIADAFSITSWSVYKWGTAGFVPNERLAKLCALTGEKAHLVCDPCIAHLMSREVGEVRVNTTKGRRIVKERM